MRRALPAVALCGSAFLVGAFVGAGVSSDAAVERYAQAFEDDDVEAMFAELTPGAQEAYPLEEFRRLLDEARTTATATSVEAGERSDAGDESVAQAVTVTTRAFGQVAGSVELPLAEERIAWEPHMAFPGLAEGERLARSTRVLERASLLTREGTPLAEGPGSLRSSPLGSAALAVAGSVGSVSGKQRARLEELGYPAGTLAGTSGLELAFDERLAGSPGGQLVAVPESSESTKGGRVLAAAEPEKGEPVRTTIDADLQEAAVTALGSAYGGVAVLDARKGDILALAGLGFSAPQPPGSTFKVITTTAALEDEVVALDDEFPVETSNSLIGREIANSHDSPCGGSFVESFASSCNTVFAPLGVDVGAEKLVETSESFGFNAPPQLAAGAAQRALDPPASTLPTSYDGTVALGETAIGQGEVLATPLQMASVAQTIANRGKRMPTSIVRDAALRPDTKPVEVTTPEVAAKLRRLMIAVVNGGTGSAAALTSVQVAGKTGTAELGPAALTPETELAPGEEPEQEKDAWFLAFAPASDPKLAVAVMLVNASGDGGEVAAPIAAQVLASEFG